MKESTEEVQKKGRNFIEEIVENDLKEGKNQGKIHTRFPPEPNGYLHIGHAKAICMDFGIAKKYGGVCNLRFDDTNPSKENTEYVDSIMRDIHWLGFDWEDRLYYSSDYFQKLYDFAIDLIKKGLAYVDDQTPEEIAKEKGTPTEAGKVSQYASRSVEENLDLFSRMNKGEFPEGSRVLRARIDMASPNMHMRDPIMYRIINTPHHRTGDKWHVYPMYDFAHGECDYFEGITHSICTLEFEVHRPLYDWFVEHLKTNDYKPQQIEFNRLNLSYTMMSKRKLLQLVQEHLVNGWDDPRMPTLCGLRRRGYTPESIRNFIDRIGYTKYEAKIDISLLESAVREHLNATTTRVSAVLNPVEIEIVNFEEGRVEEMTCINNPEDESAGTHTIPLTRHIYIERDDFREDAPKGYYRLRPDGYVRLKNAYIIKCLDYEKDEIGNVKKIRCEYYPETSNGQAKEGIKVKSTIHWVPVKESIGVEVRLYDRLFKVEDPAGETDKDFRELLNPDSLKVLTNCRVEPFLKSAKAEQHFQFTRIGYFNVDFDSTPEHLIFNRTVELKDGGAKKV